ncbi:MAG UNVERIFIED_CONTAM: hypothetical protein LVR18_35615 [Planctomycetaceae bacterium]|jgi:hypothetical protein
MPGQSAKSGNQPAKGQPAAQLEVVLSERLNYASWQNSVPVLQSVKILNTAAEALSGLTLEFESQPAFARSRRWTLDRIAPGSSISISDRDLELDANYLAGLNESELAQVTFRLHRGPHLLTEFRTSLRVPARNEWGGYPGMAELLAAFVLPNDPAIAGLLRTAADVLTNHGHLAALDGYQSQDPARAKMLAASLWSAVSGPRLAYATPPASFETEGQKTRLPSEVISTGLATCLDSTLLFAAAIEAIGLHPVVVLQKGHCFAGVWITQRTFGQIVESDVSEVRKALQSRELVLFETTLITFRPPGTFEQACQRAEQQLEHSRDADFVAAVDIQRARLSRILPLASHRPAQSSDPDANPSAELLPLPALPTADQLPVQVIEERPTTPDGRIQRLAAASSSISHYATDCSTFAVPNMASRSSVLHCRTLKTTSLPNSHSRLFHSRNAIPRPAVILRCTGSEPVRIFIVRSRQMHLHAVSCVSIYLPPNSRLALQSSIGDPAMTSPKVAPTRCSS